MVFPQLTAGDVGWCTGITYTYHGKPGRYGGFGECGSDYPMRHVPLFGPEVSGESYSAPSPQIGDTVHFVLTGPGVEYVRVGRTTITVRHGDPDVPAGDGVAVFFLTAATPPLYMPSAGTGPPYYITMFVPPHSSHEQLPPWLPQRAVCTGSGPRQRSPWTGLAASFRTTYRAATPPPAGGGGGPAASLMAAVSSQDTDWRDW